MVSSEWSTHEDTDTTPLLADQNGHNIAPACAAEFSIISDKSPSTDDGSNSTGESSSASDGSATAPGLTSSSWSQRRLLACLSVSNLLDGCCQVIQMPFFPHEASRHGLSGVASGAVFSCFFLSQMLAFPVMGWLAPRLGVTRLYTLGLLLAGLSTTVFGLLTYIEQPTPFLAACLAVRAAEAVGTAAIQTAGRAMVINKFPGQVSAALGVLETVLGAGLSLGPALGGAMHALGGYGAPFYTLGALLLATAAASPLVLPAVEDRKADETDQDDGQDYGRMVRLVFSSPDNWLIFSAELVEALNWSVINTSLEPYARSTLGLSPTEVSFFFLSSFVGYTVASPLWGRLSDAVDNTFLLVSGCLVPTTVSVLLIPPSPLLGLEPSRLLIGLGLVLRDVFQLGAYVPLLALMVRCSAARGLESDVRGQALVAAVFGAAYSVGNVLGPVGGGLVTDQLGYPALATGLGAVTAAVCLAMALRGVVYQATSNKTARGAVK